LQNLEKLKSKNPDKYRELYDNLKKVTEWSVGGCYAIPVCRRP